MTEVTNDEAVSLSLALEELFLMMEVVKTLEHEYTIM